MTLPISFFEVAPVAVMTSTMSASSFAGAKPWGRYFSRMAISALLAATRSARPPFSNSVRASVRFFTALRKAVMTSASSIGLLASMAARWMAASIVRSAVAVAESRAFMAVMMAARRVS